MALRLRAAAAVSVLVASGLLLVAAVSASDGPSINSSKFFAFGASALPPIVFSGLLIRHAGQHALNANESLRVHRQLLVLDSYVAELPDTAKALVLASLAPRFFPQHLRAEDEMLLEHTYPPADQLLAAIDPDTYAAVTGEELAYEDDEP